MNEPTWLPLEPKVRANSRAKRNFPQFIEQLAVAELSAESLDRLRSKWMEEAKEFGEDRQAFRVLVSILCDLRGKGWRFRIHEGVPQVGAPEENSGSITEQKDRVRSSLLIERDAQLRTPAVRAFVQGMEQRRFTPKGWISIFSVMRDGRELAESLREARKVPEGPERHARLRQIVDPYIQFVDADNVCDQTGIRLGDMWRYFRHTWATPYTNAPGRKFWILVRDRAVKHHPVIGIAAFGNAVVQLGPRDEWIGWTNKGFVTKLREDASREWAVWLQKSADDMLDAVYHDDFVKERLVTKAELESPTEAAITRLEEQSETQRKRHDGDPQSDLHKFEDAELPDEDWLARAKSHLFRAKRAEALARVLRVRMGLKKSGFTEPTKDALLKVLDDAAGRRAIEIVLRHVKATRVGINMLEITICGAVPPYNALLGGKLVAMLLTSPEVVDEYERKYRKSCSVIASSTAGRAVLRRPNLVALGTTSLYGVGSAMYNRIAIPAEAVGGNKGDVVRYKELGKSVGFGSIQFSTATINEIETIIRNLEGGRQINHIFGEGVSPRLRKMRAGMEAVGLQPDKLLQHGSPRIVYGISLTDQFREVLLGRRVNKPRYFFPSENSAAVTRAIGNYWIGRWLTRRIENDDVLADVEANTLVYPITHSARVELPELLDREPSLFDLVVD